jgi:ribose transport system permease protein
MSSNTDKIKLSAEQISAISRIFALVAIIIGGSVVSEVFLSGRNISNIMANASILIILGVGQTITVITNGPDLSSGSILTICAVVASILMKSFAMAFPLAILFALLLGGLLGLLNGYMIAKVGIPSFISTYGLQWAVFGFAYVILHGYVLYDFSPAFRFIGNGTIFGFLQMPIVVMAIVVALSSFLMRKTTLGRKFYSVGSNRESAKMSGINVDSTIMTAFIISGVLSALTGIVLVARINAVQSDIGKNYLLTTLATVYMGGTSPSGGQGTIGGTVIGALIITIVANCMNLMAVPSEWRDAVIGALIILTVLVDIFLKKRVSKIK